MGDFTLILFLVVGLRTLTLKDEGLQFTLSMVNPFVNLFQPMLLFLLFLFLEAFDQLLSFFCLLLIKFFPCNAIIKFSRWYILIVFFIEIFDTLIRNQTFLAFRQKFWLFDSLIHSADATKVIMVSYWRCILPKTSVYTCCVLKQPAAMWILATIFICKMRQRSIFILVYIVVFQRSLSMWLQFKSKSMISVQLRPLVELFLALKNLDCLMPDSRWCKGFFRVCLVVFPVKLWPSFLDYDRIYKGYLGLHKDWIRSVKSYRVHHFAIS